MGQLSDLYRLAQQLYIDSTPPPTHGAFFSPLTAALRWYGVAASKHKHLGRTPLLGIALQGWER